MLVQEQQRASLTAVELQPEEVVQMDAPDLCLVPTTGSIRKVAQATECKHRWVCSCVTFALMRIFSSCRVCAELSNEA